MKWTNGKAEWCALVGQMQRKRSGNFTSERWVVGEWRLFISTQAGKPASTRLSTEQLSSQRTRLNKSPRLAMSRRKGESLCHAKALPSTVKHIMFLMTTKHLSM